MPQAFIQTAYYQTLFQALLEQSIKHPSLVFSMICDKLTRQGQATALARVWLESLQTADFQQLDQHRCLFEVSVSKVFFTI